jgi:phosphoribosylaminoimidazole-succinocarboxamide synthase
MADCVVEVGELPPLRKIGQGKVRDLYEVDDETLLVVSTDRISAFDVIMTNGVPGKGKILNQITVWWMRQLESIVTHHLITDDVDKMPEACRAHKQILAGRSMLVKRLKMLPVEAIVRGYLSGSGWADYQRTGSVCGHVLPAGLLQCAELPQPLFTPSTKAELGAHDENITFAQVVQTVGDDAADRLQQQAVQVYRTASALAAERGILLADTKMEFGWEGATLVLGDECLTPDCSRYWSRANYEAGRDQDSYDKQYVRNYLKSVDFDKKTPLALPADVVEQTISKYVEIFRILTGSEPVL